MGSLDLTQNEADALMKMEKNRIDNTQYSFPGMGGSLRIPLLSKDKREEFMLDIYRSNIRLSKNSFQNRVRKSIVLVRIDIDGAPHRNPDGEEIPCPHLHLYREGYDVKWAEPLSNYFELTDDIWDLLHYFMDYCTIIHKPDIQPDLLT
jgi:uncharacterized protein DUF6978